MTTCAGCKGTAEFRLVVGKWYGDTDSPGVHLCGDCLPAGLSGLPEGMVAHVVHL